MNSVCCCQCVTQHLNMTALMLWSWEYTSYNRLGPDNRQSWTHTHTLGCVNNCMTSGGIWVDSEMISMLYSHIYRFIQGNNVNGPKNSFIKQNIVYFVIFFILDWSVLVIHQHLYSSVSRCSEETVNMIYDNDVTAVTRTIHSEIWAW